MPRANAKWHPTWRDGNRLRRPLNQLQQRSAPVAMCQQQLPLQNRLPT